MDFSSDGLDMSAYDRVDLSDAVSRQNLFRIGPDGSVLPHLSDAEFLEQARAGGLPKEVEWGTFEFNMHSITTFSMRGKISPGQAISYFASKQAAMEDQLRRDYAGAQLEEQLAQLDAVMDRQCEAYASSFAQAVGGLFNSIGADGETGKLHDSVLAAVQDQKEQYSALIRANGDYAHVQGTRDEWLLRSNDYMAAKLREAAGTLSAPARKSGLYDVNQLDSTAELARQTNELLDKGNFYAGGTSEEEIGLRCGAQKLKAQALLDTFGVTGDKRAAIEGAVDRRIEELFDLVDDSLKASRARNTSHSGYTFSPLDRGAARSVMQTMVETCKRTGDFIEALRKGITEASVGYSDKHQKSSDFRYKINAEFFTRLFTPQHDTFGATIPSNATLLMDDLREYLAGIGVVPSQMSLRA